MGRTVHAEVEYTTDEGNVHSDICPPGCDFDRVDEVFNPDTGQTYRQFLHENLDEWLDRNNGTKGFYIKEEGHQF